MPVDDAVTLRPMTSGDLEAAHGLSLAVAWPHRLEDWRVMFGVGRGFAAVDRAGALVGVALWWPQGTDFATLGMVIVAPSRQKAGIGRRLMSAIVDAAGDRRIQLNATAEGMKLYRSFGFEEVGGIRQHNGVLAGTASPVAGGLVVRPLTGADRDALMALDRRASGVDRATMLATLLGLSQGFAIDGSGEFAGYLLVRDFGRGKLLGPLVANDEATALALVSTAASQTGGFLRVDIPDDASALAEWLDGAALRRVGQVRTMLRGERRVRRGARIFGLASQAMG